MNLSKSVPQKVGCLTTDKVQELNKTGGYFTKIAGQHTEEECLKKAGGLGMLCNQDAKQPCQYYARPSPLMRSDKGDCWIIGHGGQPVDFNQTLYDNVNLENCQASGALHNLLSVFTTNPGKYQEDLKKVGNQEIQKLKKDIGEKKQELSKKQLYIKCLQTGKDYATCLKEEAKNDLALQKEEEMKRVLETKEKYQQIQDDYQLYNTLYHQKQRRHDEVDEDIRDKMRRLKRMNAKLLTKTKLIDHNNQVYQDNTSMVSYLNVAILLLVILWLGLVFYWNFDTISSYGKAAVNTVQNTVNKMNLNIPNLGMGGLNDFSNVKLRNLKDFSF